MKFSLIVFDWDGTLFDSTEQIAESICAAFCAQGLRRPTATQISRIIGMNLTDGIAKLANRLSKPRQRMIANAYREIYAYTTAPEPALFPNAAKTLSLLRVDGYRLAVATGQQRRAFDQSLSRNGLGGYFDATRCADECQPKPAPQMLQELMLELQADPEATLMVGDTTLDIQLARNSGTSIAVVARSNLHRDCLSALRPDMLLERVSDLPIVLKQLVAMDQS